MVFDEPTDEGVAPEDPIQALEAELERERAAVEAEIEWTDQAEAGASAVEEAAAAAPERAAGEPSAHEGPAPREIDDGFFMAPTTTVDELLERYPFLLESLAGYECLRALTDPLEGDAFALLRGALLESVRQPADLADAGRRQAREMTLERVAKRSDLSLEHLMRDIAREVRGRTGAGPRYTAH